jgi:hypothetical protein
VWLLAQRHGGYHWQGHWNAFHDVETQTTIVFITEFAILPDNLVYLLPAQVTVMPTCNILSLNLIKQNNMNIVVNCDMNTIYKTHVNVSSGASKD